MALYANGVQVTTGGNIDATKLTGNLPAISGASLTGITPPTTHNTVGTYGLMKLQSFVNSNNDLYPPNTTSGGNLQYANAIGDHSGSVTPSGTWRIMGRSEDGNYGGSGEYRTTLWVRIS